jgi:hypothetical protein
MKEITIPKRITKKWYREVYTLYFERCLIEIEEQYKKTGDMESWLDDSKILFDQKKELERKSLTKYEIDAKTWIDPDVRRKMVEQYGLWSLRSVSLLGFRKWGNTYEQTFRVDGSKTGFTLLQTEDRNLFVKVVLSIKNLSNEDTLPNFLPHRFEEDENGNWSMTLIEYPMDDVKGRRDGFEKYIMRYKQSNSQKIRQVHKMLENLCEEGRQAQVADIQAAAKNKRAAAKTKKKG